MNLYCLTRDPSDCISDVVGMVIVVANSTMEVTELLRNWNSDRSIRSSGGCPISMDFDEIVFHWDVIGKAKPYYTEPKILHYTYSR